MKAYLITTGALFALLTLAHFWRVIKEGTHLVKDPWYLLVTIVAVAMSLWAFRLLRLSTRRNK